jgi:hypothetical protein
MNRYLLLMVPGFALLVWRPEWTSAAALGVGLLVYVSDRFTRADSALTERLADLERKALQMTERSKSLERTGNEAINALGDLIKDHASGLKRLQENLDALSTAVTQRGGAQKPRL